MLHLLFLLSVSLDKYFALQSTHFLPTQKFENVIFGLAQVYRAMLSCFVSMFMSNHSFQAFCHTHTRTHFLHSFSSFSNVCSHIAESETDTLSACQRKTTKFVRCKQLCNMSNETMRIFFTVVNQIIDLCKQKNETFSSKANGSSLK